MTAANQRTVAVVTVTCLDPQRHPRAHEVHIHSDGTVTTPTHDSAVWGLDGEVIAALGGPEDTSACSWWRSLGATHDLSEATSRGRWYDGMFAPDGRTPLYDVTSWSIKAHGPWTEAARAATLSGLGLRVVRDLPPGHAEEVSLPDPCGLLEVMRDLKPQLDDAEQIYARMLAEAAAQIPDGDVAEWVETGIHYSWWYEFQQAKVALDDAANIVKQIAARNEYTRLDGSPAAWAWMLTQAGIAPDRIARFLARTHDGGVICDRIGLTNDLIGTLSSRNLPTTWIAEAVCAIPDSSKIVEYVERIYGAIVTTQWAVDWVNVTARARIIDNLLSWGDPDVWPVDAPEYWRWPAPEDCDFGQPDTNIIDSNKGNTGE